MKYFEVVFATKTREFLQFLTIVSVLVRALLFDYNEVNEMSVGKYAHMGMLIDEDKISWVETNFQRKACFFEKNQQY